MQIPLHRVVCSVINLRENTRHWLFFYATNIETALSTHRQSNNFVARGTTHRHLVVFVTTLRKWVPNGNLEHKVTPHYIDSLPPRAEHYQEWDHNNREHWSETANHYRFRLLRFGPHLPLQKLGVYCCQLLIQRLATSLEDLKRFRNECIDRGSICIAYNINPNNVEEFRGLHYKQWS